MRNTVRAFIILTLTCLLAGCGGPPAARTTFLSSVDLVDMTDRMAESFAQDDVISARSAATSGEPWIISINRVSNQTNQIIPEREKWLYVARLRARLAQSELSAERNLIWVIPPEQWANVQDELRDPWDPALARMTPTHQMTADFYTLTSSSGSGRADTYHCTYVLFDLASGAEIWRDAWEVKHWAEGRTYD